jgi:hypothetical protein
MLVRTTRLIILLIAYLTANADLYAQCSDAGVCVIGKKPASLRHQIGGSYTFAKSGKRDGITFHTLHLETSIQIFQNSTVLVSLPWSRQSGPLGTTSGIGDLSILWNQSIVVDAKTRLSIQVGGKLATADVNGGGLPQAYQSGLGTTDVILGVSFNHELWNAAIGYQFSRGRSDNTLTRLRRGDDIFFRAGYANELGNSRGAVQILAIKRLQESTALDANGPARSYLSIPGSDQFQINLLGNILIPVSESEDLEVTGALPLLSRKVNVDGLTRSFTLSIGFFLTL